MQKWSFISSSACLSNAFDIATFFRVRSVSVVSNPISSYLIMHFRHNSSSHLCVLCNFQHCFTKSAATLTNTAIGKEVRWSPSIEDANAHPERTRGLGWVHFQDDGSLISNYSQSVSRFLVWASRERLFFSSFLRKVSCIFEAVLIKNKPLAFISFAANAISANLLWQNLWCFLYLIKYASVPGRRTTLHTHPFSSVNSCQVSLSVLYNVADNISSGETNILSRIIKNHFNYFPPS